MTSTVKAETGAPTAATGSAAAGIAIELPYRPLWQIAGALIGNEPGVVYLDAAAAGEQGRWSILGWRPRRVIAWPQGRPGALERLRACFASTAAPATQRRVPFHGGWMGWFSYDLGRHFERLPTIARADPAMPDFVLGEYDTVLIEDHRTGALFAAGRDTDRDAESRLRQRVGSVLDAAPSRHHSGRIHGSVAPLMEPDAYRRSVERILDHIRDGDIYQANFSQRFAATTRAPSAVLYDRLRTESPAAFACYMGLPGGPEILSASPELFLRKRGRRLQTRPIKGTRPRGATPTHDRHLREELASSAKERAELLMITDLLRNDLGRVAEFGSVEVTELRVLESHATVHHAHSMIEADLRSDLGVADIIAATMPGGSVTGAPKIRAMEILEKLEPERRGPYTGAAGFIADDGDMCLNILIRTLVRHDNAVWYQVGGGIVADSDADAEYEETLAKGAALRRALEGT